MVRESFGLLQKALKDDATIVLEAAQGSLLDNTWGTYPYCTASTTISGGVTAGLGIAPRWIKRVIGVAKAYTTRVGQGPMPTELNDESGRVLQNEGKEFGTVTGRPRRCGWFDAELVAFTSKLNGYTDIALTKLDVLDTLPKIKICVGYHPRGKKGSWPIIGKAMPTGWRGMSQNTPRWMAGCSPRRISASLSDFLSKLRLMCDALSSWSRRPYHLYRSGRSATRPSLSSGKTTQEK